MADDLLLELHRRGVRLRLTEGRLDVLAPTNALTEDVRAQLHSQRERLIALLSRDVTAADVVEIVPRPAQRHEPFPLTDIQHAYWVGRNPSMELGGVATHFYLELESTGLDLRRLNESLRKVIARHDMLRAVVRPDGRQHVLESVPDYEIAVIDLRGTSPEAEEAGFERIRSEMAHRVLPPERWPLFEIRASRLDGHRLRLHVGLDLLIVDAFSMHLLFRDWRLYYEDPGWRSEPLTLTYRDYVVAEHEVHSGGRLQRAQEYWLARMDTLPPAPSLPLAIEPAQLLRPEFTRRRGQLREPLWNAVKQQAHRRGLTPSTVLVTAFADVLRRWSGQSRFTLNLSLFNRPPVHPQINEVIGDFTSLTLLALEPAPDEPFAVRVEQVQEQLMRDLEHLAYSGVRVQRERARRLGGGPRAAMPIVFTSALALSSADDSANSGNLFGGSGFFGDFRYGISQTPQVWLDHQVAQEQGTLYFNWDAVEALFPSGLLDDMFASYCRLIERLGLDDAAWDGPVQLVELPAQQAQERAAANDTLTPIPEHTLCGLVAEQVARSPEAVAVIAGDGHFSYRELAERSNRLARRLLALGVTRGSLVGVVMEKGRLQVAATLGISRSGAAYLPIEPDWPPARRRQLLEQAGVRVVVTDEMLADRLEWPPGVRRVTFADQQVQDADLTPPPIGPTPGDLAYVVFTSGSTGEPKGVMIDHRSAANTVQDLNQRFQVGPGDRVLALSTLSFDLSVYDIFGILAAGGTVVLPDSGGDHDPATWTDLIRRHGVTIWNSVPALMQAWLDAGGPAVPSPGGTDPDQVDLDDPGLRLALLSGDWIPVALPDTVRACCPGIEVISLGGATEASIWSVYFPIGEVPPDWVRIPYGKPLANQTLHVLDERFDDCPVWTVGEIHIGGMGLARGYWGDPARTAERFVLRPNTGEKLYRTGDCGRYRPGGDIEFLGRADSQIKLNGYRIELGEIAAALRRQVGVREAFATVVSNPATGRRQLVAYVVPDGSAGALGPDEDRAQDGEGRWRELMESGRQERRAVAAAAGGELLTYRRLLDAFNDLTVPLVARTFARLGAFTVAGDRAGAAQLGERFGALPRYHGLINVWLELVAARGIIRTTENPGEYRCDEPLDGERFDDQVRRTLAALPSDGPLGVLAHYVASCAGSQEKLLRGEVNVLEYLLPDGGWQVTDAMYGGNPLALLQNRVVAALVGTAVARMAPSGPIRILEVGAGVGATTAQVVGRLPASRAHYRFTDVSTFFTERARAKFAEHPFVEYGVYDIDRPPGPQAVAPGSMHLVIAANVLHNAKDLVHSLTQLRSVLDGGGLLILIENTLNEPFHTVTVGFYQDFGSYRDGRQLPLLAPAGWRAAALAAGFTRIGSIPDDGPASMGQHVLVAQAPDRTESAVDPARLRDALADLLPDYMVPQHYLFLDRLPLSANGKVDLAAVPTPWDDGPPARIDPRDGLERRLLEIWQQTLARDDFGVTDNFFELGGDSLHAVRVIGRLRDELDLSLTADEGLQLLFDSPTVAELSATLAQSGAGGSSGEGWRGGADGPGEQARR